MKNNTISGGCNDQKWREDLEQKTFASRLKEEGYRTMYAGKYLNQVIWEDTHIMEKCQKQL